MKTKLQFVITAIGVAVFMQMNAVVYADQSYPESYSAVASTSDGAFGYGIGYSSRHNADVTALNQCHSRSYIVGRFRGAGCVALARGSGDGSTGWGASNGYSNDRYVAQNEALSQCNSRGYGCHITRTDCTEG